MIHNCAHYRDVHRGYIVTSIRRHFKLPRHGKVKIIIKKGGPYRFTPRYMSSLIGIHKDSSYVGVVCGEGFTELFFRPEAHENYDITVKEVE